MRRRDKLRPGERSRLVLRTARQVEVRRDRAVADGERDLAHALNLDLERYARERFEVLRIEVAAHREAERMRNATPSEHLKAGRVLVKAAIPDDQVGAVDGAPKSTPADAYARPIWSIDLSPGLKFVAARYAGYVEEAAGAGQARGVDWSAIRVDGGGGGSSPETRILWAGRMVQVARLALDQAAGLAVIRPTKKNRRRAVSAREVIDQIVIEGLTMCDVLGRAGWGLNARNKKALRLVVVGALEAIADAWGAGSAQGAAGSGGNRVEIWSAEGADLVVGDAKIIYV